MHPPPSQPPYPLTDAVAPPRDVDQGAGEPDSASLVRRMLHGDEHALGALYDRWHPLVHAVVLRILRQRDHVEDVVEAAFWQAWQQAGRFETTRGSVQTWLLTIARRRALDRVRHLKRLRGESLEGVSGGGVPVRWQAAEGDPAVDAESAESRRIVLIALSELPAEQREALDLAYFGGFSQSEIARRTGEPLGTVKTRMRLAMQKLKARLLSLYEE
jgi:RNA polymerase sigma-70 factor (ECF subfamily)